jgi:hypothetical protein
MVWSMNLTFVVAVLAALVAFVILREVFTWYWKQNEVVGLLKTIVARLETLEASGRAPAAP